MLLLAAPARAEDALSARFDYDSFFLSYPSVTASRPLSGRSTLFGTFTTYLDYQTVQLDAGLSRAFGPWTVSPALGATFGTGSWNLSADKRQFLGRDAVPQTAVAYASETLEAEGYTAAWIPVQESRSTAVWFIQSRWWAAVKRGSVGAGPHFEPIFTKEGRGAMRLSQLWVGAHLLKNWASSSFHLFLGYDTVALGSYLGKTKNDGAAFRASFAHRF